MSLKAELQGGREWESNASDIITSLKRTYIIDRGGLPAGTAADEISAAGISGLPTPGSQHSPRFPDLVASSYKWREGTGNDKRMLFCDVGYTCRETAESEANKAPRGSPVEQWGWKSGTVSRDLVRDAGTGRMVLNSVGQPFDSIPQIDIPAPVLTKVMKTMSQKSAWASHFGKINAAAVTVGSVNCGAHCLRCVQFDEEKLWNDDFGYQWRYTIGLQLMANPVKVNGGQAATDIGWDVAIVDCGTMEINPGDGSNAYIVPIKVTSHETGKEVFVAQPVLLDGQGHAMLEQGAEPFAFRIQAYPATTFPSAFYDQNGLANS